TVSLKLVDNDSIWDAAGNKLGGPGAGTGGFTSPPGAITRLSGGAHQLRGRSQTHSCFRARKLKLQDISGQTIKGPLAVLIDHRPARVTLRNRTGLATTGRPFIRVPVTLPPGGLLQQLLRFSNPRNKKLHIRVRVFSGLGTP